MKEKEKEKICNHDINDVHNTLRKLNKRNMVFPRLDEYVCENCHEFFEFLCTTTDE